MTKAYCIQRMNEARNEALLAPTEFLRDFWKRQQRHYHNILSLCD